ncbi:hypothetical protein L9F63_015632, partial [Diploptera punctata]
NVHHLETLLRSIQSSPYTPRMSLWTTVACAPSLLHSSSFSRKRCTSCERSLNYSTKMARMLQSSTCSAHSSKRDALTGDVDTLLK